VKKLRPKEKAFVEAYCGEAKFNGTQAAITAGYSEKTARVAASKLLTKVNIHEAVERFMAKASERANVTIDSLIGELDENRAVALDAETPQASAANAATLGKARLCGLDVHRVEAKVEVNDDSDFDW
jgi:phage terminase small subunit